MRSEEDRACPVCGGTAVVVSQPFVGYVEGYVTDVFRCRRCEVHFSRRLDIPEWLYERIYEQAESIPGYQRYSGYARGVLSAPHPLDLLADSEEPYWHVREYLRSCEDAAALRVVELGCGAGYLTYALRRAGIECVGVDISGAAIERARSRYGQADWFLTLEEFKQTEGSADLVIALELVEHVADPVEFAREAAALLAPGGALLLTTPDADAARPGEVWASDTPPVHLYWYGRKALRALASECGLQAEFSAPRPPTGCPVPPVNRLRPPILEADGNVTARTRRSLGFHARLRLAAAARLWRLYRAAARVETQEIRAVGVLSPQPGATLAAVLRPDSPRG